MGDVTTISWTDHTFNCWWGCSKATGDPQCFNCYAEKWAKRCGYPWGPSAERRMFKDAHWDSPLVWDKRAEKEGVRRRVFCGSMCDIFERHADEHQNRRMRQARRRLFHLVERCRHMDWQFLTKRPGNVKRMVPGSWLQGEWPGNVWLGVSAGTQAILEHRGRILMMLPAPIRFVSCEPLLEGLKIRNGRSMRWSVPTRTDPSGRGIEYTDPGEDFIPFDWIILGGESGPGARPYHVPWARSINAQCLKGRVAVFNKQKGACPTVDNAADAKQFTDLGAKTETPGPRIPGTWARAVSTRIILADKAGRDPEQWPEDLRRREFPPPRLDMRGRPFPEDRPRPYVQVPR
jgi:protein gp37